MRLLVVRGEGSHQWQHRRPSGVRSARSSRLSRWPCFFFPPPPAARAGTPRRRPKSTLAYTAGSGQAAVAANNDTVDDTAGDDTGDSDRRRHRHGDGQRARGGHRNRHRHGIWHRQRFRARARSSPARAASTEVGVSATEIKVGSISSLSGPVPGLGGSAAGGARAYVAFRNATGGVCGRKIVLKEADDGTDNGRYRSVIDELSKQGLRCGRWLRARRRRRCRRDRARRRFHSSTSRAAGVGRSADGVRHEPEVPEPRCAVIGKYKFLKSRGANKVVGHLPSRRPIEFEAELQMRLMKAAGMTRSSSVQELPLSHAQLRLAAAACANTKADYMFFIGDGRRQPVDGAGAARHRLQAEVPRVLRVRLRHELHRSGRWTRPRRLVTWSCVRCRTKTRRTTRKWPPSCAGWTVSRPAQTSDAFAADSWAGAKAFFDNLETLPGPITRDAFVAKLKSVATYDAGGMYRHDPPRRRNSPTAASSGCRCRSGSGSAWCPTPDSSASSPMTELIR